MAQSDSKTTKDHNTIKNWTEERDGKPAVVESATNSSEGGGLLRINFPGYAEDNLKNISWEEFFRIFDENDLQFLYQEKTKDGGESKFFKFVSDN
ncbi:hypothetical protein OQ279_06245 [Salinimicrobium sp. MT39]|uniref:1,4-alpha-glucan branching enzyme n=1 Tax=Salinimicrobium profundisediminis TaxID=2994553 RepID=A0A9X3CYK8_9FLAO|nr:hypothetical protein [Salinimicrobium profundisediminis]MCX2837750.1 hypothetical protein [Salinimicrobium profundisediminis]